MKWPSKLSRSSTDAESLAHSLLNKYLAISISVAMHTREYLLVSTWNRSFKRLMSAIRFMSCTLEKYQTSRQSKSSTLKQFWQNCMDIRKSTTLQSKLPIRTHRITISTLFRQYTRTITLGRQTPTNTRTITTRLRSFTCLWYGSIITSEDWQSTCFRKRMGFLCFWFGSAPSSGEFTHWPISLPTGFSRCSEKTNISSSSETVCIYDLFSPYFKLSIILFFFVHSIKKILSLLMK